MTLSTSHAAFTSTEGMANAASARYAGVTERAMENCFKVLESSSSTSSRRRLFSLMRMEKRRTISSDLSFKSLCPRTAVLNRTFNFFSSIRVGFTFSLLILPSRRD